jgi:hypothetical protein
MYYRVATQVDAAPTWQWKSTVLSSLDTLFQWLRLYRALPHDRLRVFSSCSREGMNEQLARENQGLGSTSVMAAQFLHGRMIGSSEVERRASAHGTRGNEQTTTIVCSFAEPSPGESSRGAQVLDERGISALDKRRGELERGAGGDHDIPYRFTLPTAMPQVLAWAKLLVRVQQGELHPYSGDQKD